MSDTVSETTTPPVESPPAAPAPAAPVPASGLKFNPFANLRKLSQAELEAP